VEVGGDWYDVIVLPNGQVGLAMGDVVGHDLGAAAVMGQLRNALRAYAVESDNPGDVLERLNRFCHQQGVSDMASCIYAVLDPASGLLRMASAGHYPPLLASGSGSAHFLECRPAPPIGAVREIHYPVTERRLPPDGVLILYTDGLVERRDAAVDEGLARLRSVAMEQQAENLDQLGDLIISKMIDGSGPQDDVALLMIAPKSRLGNRIELVFEARSSSLAQLRRTVSRWLDEEGATDQESYEILVSCSEAATNAIEHAYGPGSAHFSVTCVENDGAVEITVRDWGKWRSARGQDRGRGRLLMEGLMDEVRTTTAPGGTEVWMRRRLTANAEAVSAPRERVGA
jgi:anti-sigma regulatory factor (Ser/Thr protein kinase)